MNKRAGRFLTYDQKKQAEALFREHMTEKELEPGAYAWSEGWNDLRVMEEIGASTPSQIAAFRTELGFKMQRRTQGNTGLPSKTDVLNGKVDDVAEQCVMLQERLERAFTTITALERRILDLEAAATQPKKSQTVLPYSWKPDNSA